MEEQKKAFFLCKCGENTEYDENKEQKECKCGERFSQLQEPDGNVVHFVDAPEWFTTEFRDHLSRIEQKEQALHKNTTQLYQLQYDKIPELRKLIREGYVRQQNILDKGVKRMKLDKSKRWGYSVIGNRFIGRVDSEKDKNIQTP